MSNSKITTRGTDGLAVTGSAELLSIVLTAAGDTATVAVFESTDGSGTAVLTLKAAANTTVSHTFQRGVILQNIYLDVSGTTPLATVEWDRKF